MIFRIEGHSNILLILDGTESASENISLSQMKKKNRRIKSLDHPSDSESPAAASVGQRRRHTSSGQVRSLYDGLSHLYTDCDSRLRHIPSTNYAEKKRKEETIAENAETEQRVKSPEAPVSPRISSPHRMSEEEKLANKTPTGGNIVN